MSDGTWEARMGRRPPAAEPPLERVALLWRAIAPPSRRIVECVVYRVATGWELRTQRSEADVLETHLFTRYDELGIVRKAEDWMTALRTAGFQEVIEDREPI